MHGGGAAPLVLLAAGGTGGHLFPAEALAEALAGRGVTVDLATDERAERYGKRFPARQIHVIASETLRARNIVALARTGAVMSLALLRATILLDASSPQSWWDLAAIRRSRRSWPRPGGASRASSTSRTPSWGAPTSSWRRG